MDKAKVTAVTEWPTPHTVKDLQCFLGFASFYLLFIQGFRSITTPLNALLKKCPKKLPWNQAIEVAFTKLKCAFTTAPILRHPNPSKLFIIEVDTSEPGVGAVLSQYFREQPKLHPVAFFSKKLTPAEQNYDVGNHDLLAVKLALEERHHWLEGTAYPFTIFH